MRFNIPFLGFEMMLTQGSMSTVAIENPVDFRNVVEDLWRQSRGLPGSIIVSDGEMLISFQDNALGVFNPVDIDANNRRVLNKLYKELDENANNTLIIELADLQCKMLSFIEKLVETVPYDLAYDYEIDITDFLKGYNLKINQFSDSYIEHLIDYLRAYSRVCNLKVAIFINLKSYLKDDETAALQEFVQYENMSLLTIENIYKYKVKGENAWIIDKDRCIIDLN